MLFDVTILGSNAAIPAHDRHPSSQVLNYNGRQFLIDCGEGTQFRMSRFGIKRAHLDHIFISHLHGDHYFGLVGLITSFNLNWREQDLHIYGPAALEEILLLHFKHSNTVLRFPLHFHVVDPTQTKIIYEDESLSVESILLKHRIPTTGFLFSEKTGLRKIIAERISEHQIPHDVINSIKRGADFITKEGEKIDNKLLTTDPLPSRSYAYCSDTLYVESFIEQIKGVSTLYHEATFIEEHTERAAETFHSTTKQAALIAQKAQAGKLLIGHFSARYNNLDFLLQESRSVFSESYIAEEGQTFSIG